MHYPFVANGCSFTQEFHLPEEQRWTHLCGVDVNLGMGGGSNDRIFYTTLEYFNQQQPKILIIGWTTIDRYMLPKTNGSRAAITPWNSFDENIGGDESFISDFYYKHCYNEYSSLVRTLNYMLFIQKLCAMSGTKLLYFNSLSSLSLDDASLKKIADESFIRNDLRKQGLASEELSLVNLMKLIDQLDQKIWIKKFWYSMQEHCKDLPLDDTGHPSGEGSANWADLVKQYL